MKWIALAAALAAVAPIALLVRGDARVKTAVFMLIGFLPFLFKATPGLDMAIVSWDGRPGYTHGIELTLIDILAAAVYLSLPKGGSRLPFKIVFGLYFFAIVLSIFQAPAPLAAAFYAWQFARVFFLYLVVARACEDEKVPAALLQGMGAGLVLQLGVVAWQRFGLGQLNTQGTFAHQNTLGMVANLALLPNFALLLTGSRRWNSRLVPLAGITVAALTTSRATVGLCGAGLALTYALVSLQRFTLKKAAIGAAGLIVLAALAPFIWSSFQQRFALNPLSSDYGEREAFERTAAMMLADHPMGVGANHYVVVATARGYSERAGVYKSEDSRSAHVHNAYWLAAAETGYAGVVTLALLLVWPMIVALHCAWRYAHDRRSALLLGFGSALFILSLHSFVEWIFFTVQVQYFFAIALGVIAGVGRQLGYWKHKSDRPDGGKPKAPVARA